jgi:O-antigen/teichoic acid export membrane protein
MDNDEAVHLGHTRLAKALLARVNAISSSSAQAAVHRRLAHGAVWSLFAALFSRTFALLVSVLLVRLLGSRDFGAIAVIQSTVGLLGTFAGLGLGMTATKYTAELRERDTDRLGRMLAMIYCVALCAGSIMATLCALFSEAIATSALERADLAELLALSALLLILSTLDGVHLAVLAGFEAFSRVAKVTIWTGAFTLLISGPLVYTDGLRGAVLAQVIAAAFSAIASGWVANSECRSRSVKLQFTDRLFSDWRILWRYSLPALGASLMVVPVLWVGNLILIRTPGGYSEAGIVRLVDQLRTLLLYLPTVLLRPSFAIMANSIGSPEKLGQTLRYCLTVSAIASFPLAIVVTGLGSPVLQFLYGEQYAGATTALAWAMLVAGIQASGMGQGNVINATGRMWLGLLINVLWGAAFLSLAALLIPKYQSSGYIAAMGIAYLGLVSLFYVWFMIKEPWLLAGYPLLLLLAIFGGLVFLVNWAQQWLPLYLTILLSICASAIMAGALLLASRHPNEKWKSATTKERA